MVTSVADPLAIRMTSGGTQAPSNRRLSEVSKKLVVPQGITGSYWPRLRNTCNQKLGITLDRWQDDVNGLALSKRADGSLSHTIAGMGLSICRQAGKALDVDTALLTANRGWTTMRDVRVGDAILHPSGRTVAVTEVHPIQYDHDCFE